VTTVDTKPSIADEIFDEELYLLAEKAWEDFLEHEYADYLRLVEKLEAHPENRDGADKTWVLRSQQAWREMFRRAVQVP
jgi:hypothetical protein